MDLQHLTSCSDLSEEHFADFARSREATYALLERCAQICQPQAGAGKIILFLARVALQNSWVDGPVRVDIRTLGTMFRCRLVLLRGLGDDGFEVLKKIELNASILEFGQLAQEENAILPFVMTRHSENKGFLLRFVAPESKRRSTVPPQEYLKAQARMRQGMRWLKPPPLPPDLAAALDARRKQTPQPVPAAPRAEPPARKIARIQTEKISAREFERRAGSKPAQPPAKPALGSEERKRTRNYYFGQDEAAGLPLVNAGVPAQPARREAERAAEQKPKPRRSLSPDEIDNGWDDEDAETKGTSEKR